MEGVHQCGLGWTRTSWKLKDHVADVEDYWIRSSGYYLHLPRENY